MRKSLLGRAIQKKPNAMMQTCNFLLRSRGSALCWLYGEKEKEGRPENCARRRGIGAILQMRCGTSEGEKQPDDLLEWRCKGRNVEFQMVLDKCNPKTQTRTTRNFKRARLGTASSKFSRRTDSICATGRMKRMVFLVYEAS